jgi:gluconate 2-dehydrogenase gamma chain
MSNAKSTLKRREALKIIAVAPAVPALAADHAHREARQAAAPQAPKFFTAAQLAAVTAVADVIIPADDRSPGAREAGVASFIDLMLSESPAEVQAQWREGLEALDARSRADFSKSFADATREQQTALLTDIGKNERRPRTPLERFFRAAKNLTIDGYYTSEIGIQKELRYKGNGYLKEFKGCTHPEHQG